VRSVRLDDEALVRVQGLLDGTMAPALGEEVDSAVSDGVGTVAVDLAEVPAADVQGIDALASAARRLAAAGRRLVLLLPGGGVAQVPGGRNALEAPRRQDSAARSGGGSR
jgi:anti-anti-sigma regulatory factor